MRNVNSFAILFLIVDSNIFHSFNNTNINNINILFNSNYFDIY